MLLHKGGIERFGLKLVFASKLTTLADKSLGFLDKVVFLNQMKRQGAKAARSMIRDLGLEKSKNAALAKMAEQTLDDIRTNKAASRREFDRLMLLSALNPPKVDPESLICAPDPLETYARLRAQACLEKLLPSNPLTHRYAQALIGYANDRQEALETIQFKRGNAQDGIALKSALTSCTKILPQAIARLPDDDPIKAALQLLLSNLQGDLRQLDLLSK